MKNHRQIGELRDACHQLDAVGARQHQVKQDQAGILGTDDLRELRMLAGDHHGVPGLGEGVARDAQRLRVVVDDQDAGGLGRFRPRARAG